MKSILKTIAVAGCFFTLTLLSYSQGYIVPNGITSLGYLSGLGYDINVVHNPATAPSGGSTTGFFFNPLSANSFQFSPIVDVGVRVFFVSPNNPITTSTVLSGNYSELTYPNSYLLNNGVPFYVGLYTGNMTSAPPNGIYSDPLFGWAELENVGGTIELLNSALEYQGGGIYAGTQNIIQTPEPGVLALMGLGGLLFGCRRWRKTA